MTNAFNGFSMVLGSFNHWFQWFSMVMDHWSNNAMVLMDHSPLNFHKIENFKLADPAVEGDPKIWHRSFWLSAVTLNKHKSMCALPLPPDLQLAGDIFGSSEWCSCLCWEVDSSCTKKIWRQKHAINSQSPKENRYPLESTIHHTTPKTTARLYLECWLKFLLCASSTTSMDLFLDQRI